MSFTFLNHFWAIHIVIFFLIGMSNEKKTHKKQRKSSLSGRKVRFGPKLTPEEFHKHLPPSSPLRRGSLPGKIRSQKKDLQISKQRLRLSSQLTLNTVKGNKSSLEGNNSLDSIKRFRGSPLVNKSLNIENGSSTTFTVNAEVHSGPKEKVGSPVTKPQRKSISSNTKTGDIQPTSQNFLPLDDFLKICELPNIISGFDLNVSSDLLSNDQKPLFSEVLKKQTTQSDKVSPVNKASSPQPDICMKKTTSKYRVIFLTSFKFNSYCICFLPFVL